MISSVNCEHPESAWVKDEGDHRVLCALCSRRVREDIVARQRARRTATPIKELIARSSLGETDASGSPYEPTEAEIAVAVRILRESGFGDE
jgi:hypothetical protein